MDIESKNKIAFSAWAHPIIDSLPLRQQSAVNEVLKNAFDAEMGKRLYQPGLITITIEPYRTVVTDTGVTVLTAEKLHNPMRYFGGAGVGLIQATIMSKNISFDRKNGTTTVSVEFEQPFIQSA